MSKTKMTIMNNGSVRVEGDFEVRDAEGNIYDIGNRDKISLCRCGLSEMKPFCDGAHKGHFEHEARAFNLNEMIRSKSGKK